VALLGLLYGMAFAGQNISGYRRRPPAQRAPN
jgi:hypothetical protein